MDLSKRVNLYLENREVIKNAVAEKCDELVRTHGQGSDIAFTWCLIKLKLNRLDILIVDFKVGELNDDNLESFKRLLDVADDTILNLLPVTP